MSYKCIGLLGDSIGQGYFSDNNDGWFGKLINMLNQNNPRAYSSINMAVSGERTTDVYHRFHNEALTKGLDTIFIAIGLNDLIRWNNKESSTDISEGLREEIWRRILPLAKNNMENVYIISLLPVLENRYPEVGSFKRSFYILNEDVEKYNTFLKNLCAELNIKFIDIYSSFKEHNLEELLFDADHPNEKGHRLIAEEIFKQLKNGELTLD